MTDHRERPDDCCQPPTYTPSPGFKPCPWRPVFWGELNAETALIWDYMKSQDRKITNLARKVRELEKNEMATQADVDAVTAALQAEDSALNAAVSSLTAADTAIQAEIDALKAANPAIDLSGLQAELANSQAASQAVADAVSATAALVPAPPAA